jgi:hypothetical protein
LVVIVSEKARKNKNKPKQLLHMQPQIFLTPENSVLAQILVKSVRCFGITLIWSIAGIV